MITSARLRGLLRPTWAFVVVLVGLAMAVRTPGYVHELFDPDEAAIECGLLQHGQDASPGDPASTHEVVPPYGDNPPGGYRKRRSSRNHGFQLVNRRFFFSSA